MNKFILDLRKSVGFNWNKHLHTPGHLHSDASAQVGVYFFFKRTLLWVLSEIFKIEFSHFLSPEIHDKWHLQESRNICNTTRECFHPLNHLNPGKSSPERHGPYRVLKNPPTEKMVNRICPEVAWIAWKSAVTF